jgi:hypothetical protein
MYNYKKLLQHLTLLSLTLVMIFFPVQRAHGLDILKCLGIEELILHKKKLTGPLYSLNQKFINEMSSWGQVNIKKSQLTDICESKVFSPSVNLLRHFLLYGESFFEIKTYQRTESNIAMQKSLLNSLLLKVPSIFFSYLASLQGLADDPHCLNEKIPELNYYIYQFKYLEDEISFKDLLKDKQKLGKIFVKIQNLDSILRSCKKK